MSELRSATFQNAKFLSGIKKKERRSKNTSATLKPVMQMFSHLRAVEDLEPLPLSEAEVILGPGLVVIQSHKQGHSCEGSRGRGVRRSCFITSFCISFSFVLLCQ